MPSFRTLSNHPPGLDGSDAPALSSHSEPFRESLVPVQSGGRSPGVDPTLRDRVVEQIPIMADALESAVANPTSDNLQSLREETDKLMRFLARVLLEVKRARRMH
jgi:hypothetical protein